MVSTCLYHTCMVYSGVMYYFFTNMREIYIYYIDFIIIIFIIIILLLLLLSLLLWYIYIYNIILYYFICYIVLYYVRSICIALHCIALYCIVLYCIVLFANIFLYIYNLIIIIIIIYIYIVLPPQLINQDLLMQGWHCWSHVGSLIAFPHLPGVKLHPNRIATEPETCWNHMTQRCLQLLCCARNVLPPSLPPAGWNKN